MASGRQYGPSNLVKTFAAGADLSAAAKRFTFMKVSGVIAATTAGAGEQPVGVLQGGAEAARGIAVGLLGAGGGTTLKAGAAVTAGDLLKSDSTGRAVAASAGQNFYAIALETVANADEYLEALLQSGRA